jgi:phosphate transport system substrate-binding protein
VGYKTSGVRIVPLSEKDDDKFYDGSYDHVLSGKYPLSRFLYIYINKQPNQKLDPLMKEFLTFVLSYEGQQIVIKDGYLPLPTKVVLEELKKLD